MKRLRVAVVTDALYPWHKGGKEVRYLGLLSRLPEYEMDVTVYSMKWWNVTPVAIQYPQGSLEYAAICPCIPMYRGTRRSLLQAVVFALSTLRLLFRRFDVIEADHMPYLQLLPLRLVAWIRRVPLVVTWHEVWGIDGWRKYVGRAGFVPALLERFCVRLPDAIVAVSFGTADKLAAMGAKRNRLHMVPNSLDYDQLTRIDPQSDAPELLFIGRLIEHKNANLAVQATWILSTRGYDVHLGIVGVGPEEVRLRAQVQELGLGTRVTFLSTIESQHELWSLLRGTQVLLAPSVREGYGLVVAESLALGTPVVCALHHENESSNFVGRLTGSIVAPFDAEALADAAEFWLNDVSVRSDRISEFLGEHGETVSGAISKSYAEIIRHLTIGSDLQE
jgi:glycosyltransferase involved in cell wall biosynthesis